MHFTKTHLNGNPYLGIFANANDSHLLIPPGIPGKVIDDISNTLEVVPHRTTVAGTELVGTLSVANSKGLLVPGDVTESEVETMRRALGIRVEILETRFNALGNLILVNDKGAIVAGVYGREEVDRISEALGVETRTGTIDDLNIVGSLGRASNHGALVSPKATREEIKLIEDVLRVRVERGTANFGVGNIGTCLLVNSKGVAAGMPTTGIEMGKIQQVFEEGTW